MDQTQLRAVWEGILSKIRENLSETACKQWLAPITPLSLTDTTLELGTPNAFSKDWIERFYLPFLKEASLAVTKKDLTIVLTSLEQEAPPETEPVKAAAPEAPVQPTLIDEQPEETETAESIQVRRETPEPIAPGDASSLNPKYVFETFVVGNSNSFAEAAAQAIAKSPGEIFNPFFMYGGVGLGKTHLMHAIGHRILQNFPEKRVLYITSEKFTNELINSIRDGNPEAFRQKYRNIDVLLVDDIQFLSKKEHTQEEFFHTFNTLHDANKHIILSSDRPPREIQTLEDRLRSRFEWGLIADIQTPDLETRIAILKKKALLEKLNVPNDVMVYIASRIDTNIRELEGALTRVVAYASLNHQAITTELVSEAFKNIFPANKTKEITLEVIQEIVASYFKINIDDLLSKKRPRNLSFPRQIAMYLCRELTDTSLPQIGTCFGGRDHTTVIHAYEKISKERNEDIKLDKTIKELIERIERM